MTKPDDITFLKRSCIHPMEFWDSDENKELSCLLCGIKHPQKYQKKDPFVERCKELK